MVKKQEVEMGDLVKSSMKLEEELYLSEINHKPLKVLNARILKSIVWMNVMLKFGSSSNKFKSRKILNCEHCQI